MEEQTPNTAPPEEQEPTFEESFQILYAAAPKPIQKFLQEKRYEEVADSLAHTYGLNIKQGEVLSQGLVFLLLGAQSPQDFSKSLTKKLVLAEKVSEQITSDINKLVFIPLQIQIQNTASSSGTQNIQPNEQPESSSDKSLVDTTAPINKASETATPTTKEEKVVETNIPIPPTTPPAPPLHTPTKSSSPIVKEYSVDPYREPPENS